jgi:lipoprotein-anchoring transpeptidase ErfK/SrfK
VKGRLPRAALAAAVTAATLAPAARGDVPVPPWVGAGEVPPPSWARSVAAKASEPGQPGELVLFSGPDRSSARRGVTAAGTSLPFFGTRRGSGCSGTWWLVGPLAWACSDDAELSAEAPALNAARTDGTAEGAGDAGAPRPVAATGLSVEYAFVRTGGASAYASLDAAEEGEADQELEGGWAVAVVAHREKWARTTKGLWIALQDLGLARPSTFHGEHVPAGGIDFAWVLADRASVWPAPSTKGKPADTRARFQIVHVREEQGRGEQTMVRVDDGGGWMLASDLARPAVAPPPAEVAATRERWIDVDVRSQTLVAYEGSEAVYATLVSTGRGPADGGNATPAGVHRIWVKLLASDMANTQTEDGQEHFSLEDVPYVQFFDNAVALHGTYWHGDFGHPRSHGCVNLAPVDARWLFDFTGPRLPSGWTAVFPAAIDAGTIVRVR